METKQSIIEIIKSCETVQLCTFGLGPYPETRTVFNALNRGISDLNLHFMTLRGSDKYKEVQKNPHCCLYYFNPETRMAVRLFGLISPVMDDARRRTFWHDDWKRFGYSGMDDPNFAVLEFTPKIYKFYIGNDEKTGGIDA